MLDLFTVIVLLINELQRMIFVPAPSVAAVMAAIMAAVLSAPGTAPKSKMFNGAPATIEYDTFVRLMLVPN
jgi:hypothetical protein